MSDGGYDGKDELRKLLREGRERRLPLKPGKGQDKWGTSKAGDYSPNKIYPQSRDRKGFSSTIRTSISTDLVGHVKRVVGSEGNPWGSVAAFVADAIMHRLVYVDEYGIISDPDLSRSLGNALGAARTARIGMEVEAMTQAIDGDKKAMETAWRAGDYLALEAMIGDVMLRAETTRQPFKGKMLRLCEEYGDKLSGYRDLLDEWRE